MKFSTARLCIRCRQWLQYPETDEGWTTVSVGENLYWHCPACSRRGEREAFEDFRREHGLPPMNP